MSLAAVAYKPYPTRARFVAVHGLLGATGEGAAAYSVPGGWYWPARDFYVDFKKINGRVPTDNEAHIIASESGKIRGAINTQDETAFEHHHRVLDFWLRTGRFPTGYPNDSGENHAIIAQARAAVAAHVKAWEDAQPSWFEKIVAGGPIAFVQTTDLPPELKAAIIRGIRSEASDIASTAGDVLSVAQVVVSFVPGIGAGVNAAIAAGAALAKGENITDALASGVKNALPGGPLVEKAFDAAYTIVRAVAAGQNIGDAALTIARNNLPGGDLAQRGFDAGVAIAHGQNVQTALQEGVTAAAKAYAGKAVTSLAPLALPNQLRAVAKGLPAEANRVATSIYNSTGLQKLPVAQIAKTLKTSEAIVTQALNAVNEAKKMPPQDPLIFNSPLATRTPAPRPPAIKELPLETRYLNNLVAVARKFPNGKDAEIVYIAVSADKPTAATANAWAPDLTHKVISRARVASKDAPSKVLADAKNLKPPVVREPTKPRAPSGPVITSGGAPVPTIPPSVRGRYAPYPPMAGTVSDGPLDAPRGGHGGHRGGRGGGHPFRTVVRGSPGWWWDVPHRPEVVTRTETCQTWGDPIRMPPQMETSAKIALQLSGGKPTTARGPDNVLYLFSVEGGVMTARACAAVSAA